MEAPDEQIKRLEEDLRDARERLRKQHEEHLRAQEETGADFWEEGTRLAGERARTCKARLEAARDMRAACGAAAVEQIVPEGSSVVVTLPGKVDAVKASIGVAPCEPAVEVHGVAGLKGLAVPIGAACGEAHEVGHDRHALCTEKPGHEGDHVSRGGGGREVARWPREDERKVRAQAERLFKAWAQSLGLPVRLELFGSASICAWMAVARVSLDAMVSAAACVERAAHEKGVAEGLKMRDEAAQIAIDNLRETMQEQIDALAGKGDASDVGALLDKLREGAGLAYESATWCSLQLGFRFALAAAKREEREACARIAETPFEMGAEFRPRSAGEIVSLIRARGAAS